MCHMVCHIIVEKLYIARAYVHTYVRTSFSIVLLTNGMKLIDRGVALCMILYYKSAFWNSAKCPVAIIEEWPLKCIVTLTSLAAKLASISNRQLSMAQNEACCLIPFQLAPECA